MSTTLAEAQTWLYGPMQVGAHSEMLCTCSTQRRRATLAAKLATSPAAASARSLQVVGPVSLMVSSTTLGLVAVASPVSLLTAESVSQLLSLPLPLSPLPVLMPSAVSACRSSKDTSTDTETGAPPKSDGSCTHARAGGSTPGSRLLYTWRCETAGLPQQANSVCNASQSRERCSVLGTTVGHLVWALEYQLRHCFSIEGTCYKDSLWCQCTTASQTICLVHRSSAHLIGSSKVGHVGKIKVHEDCVLPAQPPCLQLCMSVSTSDTS